jgi:beta-glucosidase
MQIELPSSFLWGAAISSYQTEGKNFNTDWCLWEKERKLEEAGIACNHYYLFKKDFELARQLNLNCLRFSLEWARVCPEPGVYLDQELEHYKEVVATLLKFNLKPIATLHHFTNPIWFVKKGGWLSSENIDFFLEYLKRTVEALKDKIEYWLIINEPLVYIYNSFVLGIWPPGVKSLNDALRVLKNIISAYIVGYEEIKMIYSDTPVQISLAKHLRTFSACPKYNFGLNSLSAYLRDRAFNLYLLDYLKKKDRLDFIAINYYCKENVRFKGLMGEECKHDFSNERKNL